MGPLQRRARYDQVDEIAAEYAEHSRASASDRVRAPGAIHPTVMAAPTASAIPAVSLHDMAGRVRPVTLAHDRLLPVAAPLAGLFPFGALQQGTTLAISSGPGAAGGSTALALAIVAATSQAGSWIAVVDIPSLGLVAARDLGVELSRLAIIDTADITGAFAEDESRSQRWAKVVGALVAAFDLVLVGMPPDPRVAQARRLQARARERGAVLIQIESGLLSRTEQRPNARPLFSADLHLAVSAMAWDGLGDGHGHLRARRSRVEAIGRQQAARPRILDLWLPGPDGQVAILTNANSHRVKSEHHPDSPRELSETG